MSHFLTPLPLIVGCYIMEILKKTIDYPFDLFFLFFYVYVILRELFYKGFKLLHYVEFLTNIVCVANVNNPFKMV